MTSLTSDNSAELASSQRRQRFLTEMGIKVQWQSRARLAQQALQQHDAAPLDANTEFAPTEPVATAASPISTPAATPAPTFATSVPAPSATAMVSKGGQDLHVQPLIHKPTVSANADSAWDDEVAASPAPAPSAAAHEVADVGILNERAAAIAQMDWVQLQAAVAQCTACALCKGRKQAVFGVGDQQAQWLLVGEGPGRTEDAQGEPFVGKSGKLLDNMLASLGLKRGQNVYIANIVKCRPSDASGNDRPPSAEEASACRPFLERQIALLQPKLMLALGKTAAVSLLQRDPQTAVASLRGRVQQVQMRNALAENIAMPVVVTYHPAYLLRKPGDKAKAWADLCLAQQQYAQA